MKYVTQVMHDLGISFDDIIKIFVDSGYTEEDADEFCCNKWSDVKDMLLFEDEECFVKLAKLFRLDRDEYRWQESSNVDFDKNLSKIIEGIQLRLLKTDN